MSIFSSKSSYVGVDIGSSSIKMVELANYKGRPRLVTYGFTEKKLDEWSSSDFVGDVSIMVSTISEIYKKSRISSKKVIAALPNFSVFTAILNLPQMPKKELDSAISWEAKKIIPMPLEEIILDWKIISESENYESSADSGEGIPQIEDLGQQAGSLKKIFSKSRKNLKVLLTGASKNLVRKYMDIFSQTGLTLLSLETESFALIRSLIGNDKSVIMVVDLGATTSSIMVVEKGIPVLTRSIEIGGMMITRSISNTLNVNLDRAEQFKQDMMLNSQTAENSLPQTVERSFAAILNEIKYTINLYQDQHNKKIEKVVLAGGCSLLGNLSGYLSRVLNINTYIGDPWARVIFPTELKPILDRLGTKFAVAIGLAMRDIE